MNCASERAELTRSARCKLPIGGLGVEGAGSEQCLDALNNA
jgi:hypothetical protein